MAVELADLVDLLRDDDYREALAEASYYREREDEASAQCEHDLDPNVSYWVLAWTELSDHAKQPYRTTVHEVLANVVSVCSVDDE